MDMPQPDMPNLPADLIAVPGRDGWYRTPIGNCRELERRVLALQDAKPCNGWQIVCGLKDDEAGHSIYVVDGVWPIELAREFRTGSHNAWPKPETEEVCEQLAKIFEIAPFRPYFIDAAGYKCRFLQPVSRQQAEAIEKVLTIGTEGYAQDDVDLPLPDIIIAENGLRLWWD